MGLKPFTKFEQLNADPEVIKILAKHYQSMDDVELLVGCLASQKDDEYGWGPPSKLHHFVSVFLLFRCQH